MFVQLKFLDCVTLGTAENLTAQFTLDCSVCCFLKAEAQFVHSFNPLALELDIYSLAHHLCKMLIFYEPRSLILGNTRHFVEE